MSDPIADVLYEHYSRTDGLDVTAEDSAQAIRDYLLSDDVIERVARELASLDPGDEWPTNEELGGSMTGTRDDEYKFGMREQARELLEVALEGGQ